MVSVQPFRNLLRDAEGLIQRYRSARLMRSANLSPGTSSMTRNFSIVQVSATGD